MSEVELRGSWCCTLLGIMLARRGAATTDPAEKEERVGEGPSHVGGDVGAPRSAA